VANLLEKVLRVGEGAILRKLTHYAEVVNTLEDAFSKLSNDELRQETAEFRERYASGESLDDLLPEAFAAVRVTPTKTKS
jgi:preprotein translocase subunit SecA